MSFWFLQKPVLWDLFSVFSTYVEVILNKAVRYATETRILHVCGGDPNKNSDKTGKPGYSPRMWRWSHIVKAIPNMIMVFSTYVEVILYQLLALSSPYRILHVCGGDPLSIVAHKAMAMYSPRMWRWS